ncbi:hypothetical protein T484DRAFT_1856389 [Baffinella frigidus]|nr:hypothetical protein T484DRAFT_1856389 [Cryptophyta sp. CCMP2293]
MDTRVFALTSSGAWAVASVTGNRTVTKIGPRVSVVVAARRGAMLAPPLAGCSEFILTGAQRRESNLVPRAIQGAGPGNAKWCEDNDEDKGMAEDRLIEREASFCPLAAFQQRGPVLFPSDGSFTAIRPDFPGGLTLVGSENEDEIEVARLVGGDAQEDDNPNNDKGGAESQTWHFPMLPPFPLGVYQHQHSHAIEKPLSHPSIVASKVDDVDLGHFHPSQPVMGGDAYYWTQESRSSTTSTSPNNPQRTTLLPFGMLRIRVLAAVSDVGSAACQMQSRFEAKNAGKKEAASPAAPTPEAKGSLTQANGSLSE